MVNGEQAAALPCIPELADVVVPAVTPIQPGTQWEDALSAQPHAHHAQPFPCLHGALDCRHIPPTRLWPTRLR